MSQAWITASTAAEAVAQHKQIEEDFAYERFRALRAELEAAGRSGEVVDALEFHCWMRARNESDEAWGAWAMVMDSKPVS